jgi:hypothetical protein
VADSSFEAENKARQFSPGVPYVTLEPRLFTREPVLTREQLRGVIDSLATSLADFLPDIPPLMRADPVAPPPPPPADADLDKLLEEIFEALEKARKDGTLTDDKLVEAFPPRFRGGASFVGGTISDGAGHENLKNWLIDTGASVSCITKKNFERLQKKGAKPKQEGELEVMTADGVKKYPKYSGLPMGFGRKNKNGKMELAKCDIPIIVAAGDILGLDQLKHTGTKLIIDPAGNSVELVER